MATSNNTQTATSAIDVIAVLDKDYNQVFPDARPIKATIIESSKAMEHPVETGAVVVDHRVLTPKEIELSMVLTSAEYADVYQQIKTIFKAGDTLNVQTRVDAYPSMIILDMPHEESADMQDGVTLALKLREVIYVAVQYTERKIPVVTSPKNSKTTKRGEQRPTETPEPKKSSFLSRLGLVK